MICFAFTIFFFLTTSISYAFKEQFFKSNIKVSYKKKTTTTKPNHFVLLIFSGPVFISTQTMINLYSNACFSLNISCSVLQKVTATDQ